MSNMANIMDITAENTAPSSNVTNGAMEDNTSAVNSFIFVTKTREDFEESSSSTSSSTLDHQVPRVIEPLPSSWFQESTTQNLASTPPPDEIPVTQAQLVYGAGCLFPSLPPSRASSLTVSSEAAHHSSSSGVPTTPVREVVRFGDNDDFSTPVIQRKQATGILFPPGIPWTPPNSTPRPTRGGNSQGKKKRSSSSSPRPSPRPPKLARFQRWGQSLSSSSIPRLVEDEGYCEELLPSEQSQQTLAFRNAQEQTFVLATSTDFQPNVASTTRDGRFHVFGSSLTTSNDADGNDGDDEAGENENDGGESIHSMSATLDGRSEDLALRPASIGGTSVRCHYGQDDLIAQVEWFTEDEIEAQLSELLAAYRAVYLVSLDEDEEDLASTEQKKDKDPVAVEKADSALEVFKMMAHSRLNWTELEMILKEEEEDVLDVFMTWVQDMTVPKQTRTETFLDIRECLGYLRKLSMPLKKLESDVKALPFIRKIRLWSNGCLDRFLDGLPGVRGVNASGLSFDGAIEWEFDKIYCGLAEKEVAELVAAWDDFMIR